MSGGVGQSGTGPMCIGAVSGLSMGESEIDGQPVNGRRAKPPEEPGAGGVVKTRIGKGCL